MSPYGLLQPIPTVSQAVVQPTSASVTSLRQQSTASSTVSPRAGVDTVSTKAVGKINENPASSYLDSPSDANLLVMKEHKGIILYSHKGKVRGWLGGSLFFFIGRGTTILLLPFPFTYFFILFAFLVDGGKVFLLVKSWLLPCIVLLR